MLLCLDAISSTSTRILVGERSGKKYIEAISRILDIEIAA